MTLGDSRSNRHLILFSLKLNLPATGCVHLVITITFSRRTNKILWRFPVYPGGISNSRWFTVFQELYWPCYWTNSHATACLTGLTFCYVTLVTYQWQLSATSIGYGCANMLHWCTTNIYGKEFCSTQTLNERFRTMSRAALWLVGVLTCFLDTLTAWVYSEADNLWPAINPHFTRQQNRLQLTQHSIPRFRSDLLQLTQRQDKTCYNKLFVIRLLLERHLLAYTYEFIHLINLLVLLTYLTTAVALGF